MAIQCVDIETLVQTYLDGELTETDAQELKAHLAACARCNGQAGEEARFHRALRSRLAAVPAPAHLRGQIALALDREDWNARKQRRSGRAAWALPALASMAAAAALVFFVVSMPAPSKEAPVTAHAVRQHIRRPPIEVQGAAVSPWVKKHFSPVAQVPRFSGQHTSLRGARLSHMGGRDAVQLYYQASVDNRPYEVSAMIVRDAAELDLRVGRRYVMGGRELWVGQSYGYNVVTHKDGNGIGYVFISEMDAEHLLRFMETSDLILQAGDPRPLPR